MNVKQLKELLEQFPDDMTVIVDCHSDYAKVSSVEKRRVVDRGDDWFERTSEYRQRTEPHSIVECVHISTY